VLDSVDWVTGRANRLQQHQQSRSFFFVSVVSVSCTDEEFGLTWNNFQITGRLNKEAESTRNFGNSVGCC